MNINRRNVLLSAPPAMVAGTGLGAIATCGANGIQIDPAVLTAIQDGVAQGCNFIPAVTTLIALVDSTFPAVNGAGSIAQSVLNQITTTLCAAKTQAGKLGGTFKSGGADVPLHGWEVVNGKLTYV